MPNPTLDEAVKEAYASCPSNVITWETLQFSHPTLPDGDVWVVKNRENLTLGLEPGATGSEHGPNPGDPGPEPEAPTNPGDPGPEPQPGYEPDLNQYIYLACNGGNEVLRSNETFDRYGLSAYSDWVTAYDLWNHPDPDHVADYYDDTLRQNAVDAATAAYNADHAEWVTRTAAHAAWVVASAAYDAYLAALATYSERHDAWEAALETFEDWQEQTSAEALTQEFVGLPFELTLAASGESGIQELSISCCDVDRVFSDWLMSVAESGSLDPIEVTYRVYVSTDTSRPSIDPPLKLYLTDPKIDVYTVSARASFADIVNRPFPNDYYDRKHFPSLGG